MQKNYFYFYRFLLENRKLLVGTKVTDLFTQSKNRLFITIPSESLPDRHLIIDTTPNLPFLLVKKEHKKAKKNIRKFLPEFLPSKITEVEISENDRIIKIITENFDLFFTIKGPKTNVYFIIENKIESAFKNVKDTDIFQFLTGGKFLIPDSGLTLNLENFYSIEKLQKAKPFFNKFIIGEYYSRLMPDENKLNRKLLQQIIDDIIFAPISVAFVADKLILAPANWSLLKDSQKLKEFNYFNNALEFYITTNYKYNNFKQLKKELNNLIETRINQISQKLNKLKFRIDRGSKEQEYRLYADLLQIHRHLVTRGKTTLETTDFNNKKIIIKLDPQKSIQGNIDYYYEKARDEKVAFEKSKELYRIAQKEYVILLSKRNELAEVDNLNDLKKLKETMAKGELKVKMRNQKIKFRHFLIDSRYHLFVGRDSKENDELTFKFAKQNDYWFHARGYAGSHAILKVENKKEKIPRNIIKAAASVAAFYSKGKTASVTPVSFTFRKFVHKKKGMPAGQVLLQKEESVLVKPEIPSNCEQIFDEQI